MKVISNVYLRDTSKAGVLRLLRELPAVISGRLPDNRGLARSFKSTFVHSLFTSIHRAFLQKSDGRADDTGGFWKPLKRSTIAARPLVPGERKALGISGLGRGGRGLLTADENRLWRGIFRSTYFRLLPRLGEPAAKARAGKLAWAILKARGAKTRLWTLGGRKVPILIVSGRLEASLTPGTLSGEQYIPPKEQILEFHAGKVTIGSKVPYSSFVHKKRRLWPALSKMTPWIRRATRESTEAMAAKLTGALK